MRDGCNVKATTTTTTIKAYKSRQRVTSGRRADKQGFLQKRGDHRPAPPSPALPHSLTVISEPYSTWEANVTWMPTRSHLACRLHICDSSPSRSLNVNVSPPGCVFLWSPNHGGTDVVRIGFCLWNGCSFFPFFFFFILSYPRRLSPPPLRESGDAPPRATLISALIITAEAAMSFSQSCRPAPNKWMCASALKRHPP